MIYCMKGYLTEINPRPGSKGLKPEVHRGLISRFNTTFWNKMKWSDRFVLILGSPWTFYLGTPSLHVGGLLREISETLGKELTYTGHLVQVKLVTVEAVTGVAFSHANAAAVFTPVQDSTFLRSETLEAIVALWLDTEVWKRTHVKKHLVMLLLLKNNSLFAHPAVTELRFWPPDEQSPIVRPIF